MTTISRNSRIYVAGHRGMVGAALVRRLRRTGYANLLLPDRKDLDLLDQSAVHSFLRLNKPDFVFIAAARVGGIHANNTLRADFIYQNLEIQNNLVAGSHEAGVERLMFLGSSCIYPRDCPQPIKEDYLLTGPLEITNEPYAIAKIAGIKLVEAFSNQYGRNFFSVMPTNLYGPNDNYDLLSSHVLPALIRKAHEAHIAGSAQMVVWGSGTPRREFLHVDDLADACIFLMESGYQGPLLNIGTGTDVTIAELARLIADIVGFKGELIFDKTKPDGTPRKLLDVSRLRSLGWTASIPLDKGIAETYQSAAFFTR